MGALTDMVELVDPELHLGQERAKRARHEHNRKAAPGAQSRPGVDSTDPLMDELQSVLGNRALSYFLAQQKRTSGTTAGQRTIVYCACKRGCCELRSYEANRC